MMAGAPGWALEAAATIAVHTPAGFASRPKLDPLQELSDPAQRRVLRVVQMPVPGRRHFHVLARCGRPFLRRKTLRSAIDLASTSSPGGLVPTSIRIIRPAAPPAGLLPPRHCRSSGRVMSKIEVEGFKFRRCPAVAPPHALIAILGTRRPPAWASRFRQMYRRTKHVDAGAAIGAVGLSRLLLGGCRPRL